MGCTGEDPPPPSGDGSSPSPASGCTPTETAQGDTGIADTAPGDTALGDSGETLPMPTCDFGPVPSFSVRYAGASPEQATVPIVVADGLAEPEGVGAYCLRQSWPGGGEVSRCVASSAQTPALYARGLPAPGQTVTIELGVMYGEQTCWSGDVRAIKLGEPPTDVPFDYTSYGPAIEVADYPPVAIGSNTVGSKRPIYMIALADAPAYGIAAADVLWSLDANRYSGGVVEVQSLSSGLLAFTASYYETTEGQFVFDPGFAGTRTIVMDWAGYEWSRTGTCDPEAPGAVCVGFVHHGDAAMFAEDVYVTNSYEVLTDEEGQPVRYTEEGGAEFVLLSTIFKAFSVGERGELSPRFELSFQDLLDPDVTQITTPGITAFPGPDGETYKPAWYVNSTELRSEAGDPERYHLTGTMAAVPFQGFFDIVLRPGGEVLEQRLYDISNEELYWLTDTTYSPLSSSVHSAELIGVDPSTGSPHYAVYDRNAKTADFGREACASFFHMVDDGGTIEVGGPYITIARDLPGLGDVCGNSYGYGNVSILYDLSIEGIEGPAALAVLSDNVAAPPEEAGEELSISEIYYDGSPRVTGLFVNPDPLDPHGWTQAATLLGTNPADVDASGFVTANQPELELWLGADPFVLDGI